MKFKKFAAAVMAVTLAAGALALVPSDNSAISGIAITAEAEESDFVTETYDDGSKWLSYEGEGGDVVLPGGYTIYGGNGRENITSITILGDCELSQDAFGYCPKLKSVTFEGDVEFDVDSFYGCPALETVTVKGSVKGQIGAYAFGNCESLKTFTIEKDNEEFYIDNNAFDSCHSLTSINIPSKCTEICEDAFLNCVNLTSLTIPANTKITTNDEGVSHTFGMYLDERDGSYGVADGVTSIVTLIRGDEQTITAKYSDYGYETDSILYAEDTIIPKAITLTVTPGSPAETFAKENGVKYQYASAAAATTTAIVTEPEYAENGKLVAPKTFSAAVAADQATVNWNSIGGANGYEIVLFNTATGDYEHYKTVSGTSCTFTGLESGKKYVFKVTAITNSDGKAYAQNYSYPMAFTTK